MTLPEVLLGVMFVGLIAYALFGGADFGAGIWDLLAGGTLEGGIIPKLGAAVTAVRGGVSARIGRTLVTT